MRQPESTTETVFELNFGGSLKKTVDSQYASIGMFRIFSSFSTRMMFSYLFMISFWVGSTVWSTQCGCDVQWFSGFSDSGSSTPIQQTVLGTQFRIIWKFQIEFARPKSGNGNSWKEICMSDKWSTPRAIPRLWQLECGTLSGGVGADWLLHAIASVARPKSKTQRIWKFARSEHFLTSSLDGTMRIWDM